jgi:hypothetical protein
MKTTIGSYASKGTLLIAALLAACLLAGSAHAQAQFHGKFTLPYEVQWGRAVLPAGSYLLSFTTDATPTAVIREARTLRIVAFETSSIQEDSKADGSALLISLRGDRRIVHSLRVAEIGEVYVFNPALAHRRRVEEARRIREVPVLVAEK